MSTIRNLDPGRMSAPNIKKENQELLPYPASTSQNQEWTLLSPHEPIVKMKVGSQTINIMVDTGAEHYVVMQRVTPLSRQKGKIIGATGTTTYRLFCGP